MCLTIQESVKPKFNKNGVGIFYKILRGDLDGSIYSPFHDLPYKKESIIQSSRVSKQLVQETQLRKNVVLRGIHVFLNNKEISRVIGITANWTGYPKNCLFAARMVCLEDDLVAAGIWSDTGIEAAVFMKVKFTSVLKDYQ